MGLDTLITPAGSNFLKNFPAAHSINMDAIDDYAGPCLTSDGLSTYTPQLFGTTSPPVIGTGGSAVNRAYYYRIFDEIFVWGELRFGTSGASGGTGIWSLALPFTAKTVVGASTNLGSSPVVGIGSIHDDSATAGRTPLTVHLRTTTQIMFGIKMNSGLGAREVSSSIPFAWQPSDGIQWSARFQRA